MNGQNDKVLSYLYEHTLRKVKRFIIMNNGTAEEANDIFQDAVIVLFNQVKLNKYNRNYEVDGFIFSVSRNLWIDKVRRGKRMPIRELVDIDIADSQDLLMDMISKEKTSAMRKAFERLDEKCRKILNYAIYQKLSMREIAEKMGYSSENVAKTNHYRCKQYLSKIVKEDNTLLNLLEN